MWLTKFLGVLIGEWISYQNQKWQVFLLLKEISEIVLNDSVNENLVKHLQTLITEHHTLFLKVYDKPLRPKHHFMLHYPEIMRKIGPLTQVWSMRCEAKHKELKQIAKSTTSRKNICQTIMQRYILSQNKQNSVNFFDFVEPKGPKINPSILQNISGALIGKQLSDMIFYKWIVLNNRKIKIGSVISFGFGEEYKNFYQVLHIIELNNSKVEFIVSKLNILFYDGHRCCYVVEKTTDTQLFLTTNYYFETFVLISFQSQLLLL